jgi:triosephosphate isomerase
MLAENGVQFAIIGHSERRQFYGETNECVAKRARAAINHDLKAIVCIGESEVEFKEERTEAVVTEQFNASLEGITAEDASQLVIAYEPVWAIGTGLAATPEIAQNVHQLIRGLLCQQFGNAAGKNINILYGGSTKPDNIASLMQQSDVDGALVGGASLDPDSFANLIINGREAQ